MNNSLALKIALYGTAALLLIWMFYPVSSNSAEAVPPTMQETFEEIVTNSVEAESESDSLIRVENGWAKATLAGQHVGAGYLTLTNTGERTVALIAAETPLAGRVEIHTHTHEGDVMKMRKISRLDLMPNATQTMKPGGLHLMLFDLTSPLKAGESLPITLRFSDDSELKTLLNVKEKPAS